MSETPRYTEFHPRWHRPHMSTYWWLKRGPYLAFILRELSSVCIAWFIVFMLLLVRAVSQSHDRYSQFLEWCKSPILLVANVVALFFILFHSVTWLNLAPKAMVVRVGGRRVPPAGIVGANYAAWAMISAILAWLVLGG
jgi:fumarate reductase subunit C